MTYNPLHSQSANEIVEQYIGTAYDNVKAVAENLVAVETFATNIDDILTLSSSLNEIVTVANGFSSILAVENDLGAITTAATNIANINAVADISTQVVTVGNLGDNINLVANVAAHIPTLANAAPNITTVAEMIDNIQAVFLNQNNINIVGGNIADVTTVADVSTDITSVSDNLPTLNAILANLVTIQDAANVVAILERSMTLRLGAVAVPDDTFTTMADLLAYADARIQAGGSLTILAEDGTYAISGTLSTSVFSVDIQGTSQGGTIFNSDPDVAQPGISVQSNRTLSLENLTFNTTGSESIKVTNNSTASLTFCTISSGQISARNRAHLRITNSTVQDLISLEGYTGANLDFGTIAVAGLLVTEFSSAVLENVTLGDGSTGASETLITAGIHSEVSLTSVTVVNSGDPYSPALNALGNVNSKISNGNSALFSEVNLSLGPVQVAGTTYTSFFDAYNYALSVSQVGATLNLSIPSDYTSVEPDTLGTIDLDRLKVNITGGNNTTSIITLPFSGGNGDGWVFSGSGLTIDRVYLDQATPPYAVTPLIQIEDARNVTISNCNIAAFTKAVRVTNSSEVLVRNSTLTSPDTPMEFEKAVNTEVRTCVLEATATTSNYSAVIFAELKCGLIIRFSTLSYPNHGDSGSAVGILATELTEIFTESNTYNSPIGLNTVAEPGSTILP